MKGIECAFAGKVDREPVKRTSTYTGRDWVSFSVVVGEDQDAQRLDVACFGPSVDVATALNAGDQVYCEGKIKLRRWDDGSEAGKASLSVSARLIQPMGKIGQSKPKRTRAAKPQEKPKADVQAPLDFNDPLPF